MNKLIKLMILFPVFLLFAMPISWAAYEPDDLTLNVSIDIHNIDCSGESDGALQAIVDGGLPPYEYEWSNGNTKAFIAYLDAGQYSVTVTDSEGNTATADATLVDPSEIEVSNVQLVHPSCDQEDGSIFIDISGGTPPYDIVWANGDVSEDLTNAPNGEYTLVVRDANDCNRKFGPYELIDDCDNGCDAPNLDDFSVNQSDCENTNGSIFLSIEDVNLPHTFEWSNGDNTEDVMNLEVGTYSMTLTDNTGCTAVFGPFEIEDGCDDVPCYYKPDVVDVVITPADCGEENGAIDITVEGADAPFTFSWNSGQDTEDISGLEPGNYGVVIVDTEGCEDKFTFIVKEDCISITVTSSTPPLDCADDANGTVDFSVVPEDADVSFEIIDQSNGQVVSNGSLTAGSYCYTAVDNQTGNTIEEDCFEISAPSPIEVDLAVSDVDCDGPGAINTVDVTGGDGDYTFDWSNISGNDNPQDNLDLPEGQYALTVTDGLGCQITLNIPVGTESEAIQVANANLDQPACGEDNGAIDVGITGGSGDYTYSWNGVEGTSSLSDLPPGNYDLEVVDNITGCSTTANYNLDPSEDIALSAPSDTATCDNSITLSADSPGNTIEWYDANGNLLGTGTEITLDLPNNIGNINVVATSDQDCSTEANFNLSQDVLNLSSELQVQPACLGIDDGSIAVEIDGGSGDYTYTWNDEVGTNNINDLAPGTYVLEVLDNVTGCSITQEYTVTEGASVDLQGPGDILSCDDMVAVSASSSTATNFDWFDANGTTIGQGTDIDISDAGMYTVVATDANGCTAEDGFEISQDELVINAGENVNTCFVEEIELEVYPQGVDYIWSEDPNFGTVISNTDVLVGSTTGTPGEQFTYYVQGTNANGCVDIDTVQIAYNGISIGLMQPETICEGESATASVAIALGTPGSFTFNWYSDDAMIDATDPEFVQISSQVSTEVTVEIQSDLGCAYTETFDIEVPVVEGDIEGDPLTIFQGDMTSLEVMGGGPEYTYQWSGDETLSSNTGASVSASPMETTEYSVLITDENGCTTLRTVVITVDPPLCNNRNIFFPNAFTPNGDNVNDVLYLRGNSIEESFFVIYDRWGEKVFESNSINHGWDGTYKNKQLGNDVFGYYLRVICADGEEFFQQGNVSLLR